MNKRSIKLVKLSLLFFALIFNSRNSFAQEAEMAKARQLFFAGNWAYKEAKFEAAIESYEKVINLGLENGNLYYNLGNSYFKKGELGKAVLNYEKALFFIPNDSDLKSNHEYILSSLNLGAQFSWASAFPWAFRPWSFEKFANRLFEGVTINFLTIFLSVIYMLAILVLISNLFFPKAKKRIKILFLALLVLFILPSVSLYGKITYLNKGAVVINKEAEVKFEPLEGATTYFKLIEGSKVEILEKVDSWYKIKRLDGKIGWIEKKEIGLISDL